MIFAQALALDFATLAMVSRCGPFMAFDADIVDELLLCAASVHPIFGLPQCISAHNCDTKTMLRLMAFLDLCWFYPDGPSSFLESTAIRNLL